MMRYIEIGSSDAITLAAFKAWANITDSSKDEQLADVLKQAAIRVQEYADRALYPCTIEVDGEGAQAQLWQPLVATVVSVTDWATDEGVLSRCLVRGSTLLLPKAMHYTVRYTTQPLASEVSRLLGYVWEMASAMWDGNTDEETRVYKRIPCDYVVH